MGVLKLSGSLDAGPPSVSSSAFPASSFSVPLALLDGQRGYDAATNVLSRAVNTPEPDWVRLSGVGTGEAVYKGQFLYFKSDSPLWLRFTYLNALVEIVTVLPKVHGMFVQEFGEGFELRKLEAQGVSRVEYLIAGTES